MCFTALTWIWNFYHTLYRGQQIVYSWQHRIATASFILQLVVRPCVQLFQIWWSYSKYLLIIAVAIPSQAQVNALLGLLKISHINSKFVAAIPRSAQNRHHYFKSGLGQCPTRVARTESEVEGALFWVSTRNPQKYLQKAIIDAIGPPQSEETKSASTNK